MSKTVEDIGTLKINLLSQAQYDAEKAGGRLADDELYLTPSSGGGGGASAFIAEYGVTTYADVKDAYDEDAIILCTVDDSGNTAICQLAYYDDANDLFYFAQPQSDGFYLAIIASDDTWDDSYFQFASTDTATQLRDGLMSALDWQKLDGIASGAEVNVQSNWSQSDSTADDYIKNKPTIPTITDTYSGTSSNGMSGKAVKSAIDALDGTISGSAGAGKTLTAFSQTDGKVSATFSNISITKSQVSDFPTIPTVNDATLTIQKNGTTVNTFTANASSNVTANITVPTDTGDLTNGAGFITTETDPTVPSWAKQVSKPSYTASEVGALPDTTPIPSKTSDLNNDSGFITGVTSTSTPTASTISEYDSTAHMNSTDMTSAEVSSFVGNLGYTFNLIDMFYPIGSYYETSDTSFNPNITWGGTWTLETEGQVHVSAGENYEVGDTGGEATHTLTITEMPVHGHNTTTWVNAGTQALSKNWTNYGATLQNAPAGNQLANGTWKSTTFNSAQSGHGDPTGIAEASGNGQPHNNMPPYIVVNRWHRTA